MNSDYRRAWELAGGAAPSHWGFSTIEELLKHSKAISVGVMYPGSNTENGVPLVKVSDVKNGSVVSRPEFLISDEKDHEYRRTRLLGNELLITLVGNPGDCALATPEMAGWNAARAIAVLRLKDLSLRRWVRYVCLSRPAQHFLDSRLNTTVQKTLNLKDIRELVIPIPPDGEREYITSIIKAFEDKIELNRQMNATLEAMAQALFKSWFVDFDPVIDKALAAGNPIPEPLRARADARKALGDQRKPLPEAIQNQFPDRFVFNDELGWVPEGWSCSSIGEICDVVDCLHSKKPVQTDEPTEFLLLQLSNIMNDGLIDLTSKYFVSRADYEKWTSRIEVMEGDCVITNVGRVGAVSIVPPNVRAAMGRNMTAVRLKTRELPAFLITLLNSDYMKIEISRRTDVGTILNALNVRSIPKLRFLDAGPLLEVYEEKAVPLLKKRQDLKVQCSALSSIRDTLLPKLLSGQLRVPDSERLTARVT